MKRLLGALLNYFIKGLLIVVPLGAAFFLIFWAVSTLDNALNLSADLWVDKSRQAYLYPRVGHP
jgi:uncharacterized membrane protein